MPSFEDLCHPLSDAELERRWRALRSAMAERDVDALLVQANNSFHGGYLRWLTDQPAVNGGWQALVFPRDGGMVGVRHGPQGQSDRSEADPVDRGFARIRTAPTFAAVDYKKHLAADHVLEELRPRMPATIGLVGTLGMSHAFAERVQGGLNGARFVDFTDAIDAIKAVKSDEEIACIRRTAAMQDTVWERVLPEVKPGVRNFEISALAQYVGQTLGSEQGLFLAGSRPLGEPSLYATRHFQNRRLEAGDQFTLLIENAGPGGYYCEMGRTVTLGRASDTLLEEYAFSLEAQQRTLELIRPGAHPPEVLAAYNDFMRANGRPEETRLHVHNQGVDVVERPLVCAEERLDFAAGMNLAVHPTWVKDGVHSWVSDNFLVTENGVGDRLHRTPQQIFEL